MNLLPNVPSFSVFVRRAHSNAPLEFVPFSAEARSSTALQAALWHYAPARVEIEHDGQRWIYDERGVCIGGVDAHDGEPL
jgi:hypothetical protein